MGMAVPMDTDTVTSAKDLLMLHPKLKLRLNPTTDTDTVDTMAVPTDTDTDTVTSAKDPLMLNPKLKLKLSPATDTENSLDETLEGSVDLELLEEAGDGAAGS